MRSPVRREPLSSVHELPLPRERKPGGTAGLSPVPVYTDRCIFIRPWGGSFLEADLWNLEKSLSYLNISQMHNKNTMQSAPVNPWHQPNTAQCRNDNFVSDAKTERDFRDFTDKICEISMLEPSFNRRSVLKKFFAQWHIERFICSNESAKQADPNIAPEFMTDEEKGYYWAVPLDKPGFYMVYPDPSLSYEQSRHSSKGYKEVFDTGYESGAYNFEPEKPAVFYKQGKQWIFKIKGKLRLERT